jgi:hypothetical protein
MRCWTDLQGFLELAGSQGNYPACNFLIMNTRGKETPAFRLRYYISYVSSLKSATFEVLEAGGRAQLWGSCPQIRWWLSRVNRRRNDRMVTGIDRWAAITTTLSLTANIQHRGTIWNVSPLHCGEALLKASARVVVNSGSRPLSTGAFEAVTEDIRRNREMIHAPYGHDDPETCRCALETRWWRNEQAEC